MIRGFVNKALLPIIPVSIKKMNRDWQEFEVLLDTGYGGEFMIALATLRDFYNLPSIDQIPYPYERIELKLDGNPREVEAEIIKPDDFSGVIGPSLLLGRRIVIDVEENGLVEIDWIPMPTRPTLLTRLTSILHRPYKSKQQPSDDYRWKLPWANLKVRDNKGVWQPRTVNVDTGDSGKLSLPPSLVEEFGLRLPDKCRVYTPCGPLDTCCGEVEIFWQGNPCTVQCVQLQEKNPPLVGMKLLRGNRITIDLSYEDMGRSFVEIAPIPQPEVDMAQGGKSRPRPSF